MFRFTPRTIPNQILIVGCGGTGSRLVPLLTQFIASISKDKNPRGWLDSPTIFLADDDVVEQKNLQRQNFVAVDVGKHKSAVLAQRYGRAYGVNVLPITNRIDGTSKAFANLPVPFDANRSIVIMCVDSAQARRDIIRTINGLSRPAVAGQGAFFIDAGNEDNFGQVRFFNQAVAGGTLTKVPELPKLSPVVIDIPAIPMDVLHYATLEDNPGLGSCADLDQTLAINALMATMIMGIVQNYYYVKPMTFHQMSISLDGGVSTSFNTAAELARLYGFFVGDDYRTHVSKVTFSNFPSLDSGRLLDQYVKETNKVMKAMQPTVVSETAVEGAPATPVKRSRAKKKAEPGLVDTLKEAVADHVEALLPDVRNEGAGDTRFALDA